jgi:hypothetical protein
MLIQPVRVQFYSTGWEDSVGTVVTSHLGVCDIPLELGSVVSTADRVYASSTLHDARPSINCLDSFSTRYVGFVRLRHGVKQAGYARVRSSLDNEGNRVYWIEQISLSKVPWTGIRIL